MALPVSVGDILKILDKVPEWVGLKRMQARIEALEAKVAALEAAAGAKPPADKCPACEAGALRFVSEAPDPTFGPLGVLRRVLRCDQCGHTTARQIDTVRK